MTHFEFEHLCYAIAVLVMLNFLIGTNELGFAPRIFEGDTCEIW